MDRPVGFNHYPEIEYIIKTKHEEAAAAQPSMTLMTVHGVDVCLTRS